MTENNHDEEEGPIIVRRIIYEAACELEEKNKTDGRGFTDWDLADEQAHLAGKKDDIEQQKFWREVFNYLMEYNMLGDGTTIEITE